MSNPAMTVPTEEQTASLQEMLDLLKKTQQSTSVAAAIIGGLRDELNYSRRLLAELKDVVGPRVYRFRGDTSWIEEIEKRITAIDKALK